MNFDLERYFERIGYLGPRTCSRETLDGITFAHTCSVPFENLDVLAKIGISIEPEAIFEKIVHKRRGGYCFEQNTLLLGALEALGFSTTPLGGRVRIDRLRNYTPPRTHLFVAIDLPNGERWMSDVGVGALSLTAALQFPDTWEAPPIAQKTPHETRRLIREEGRLFHQVSYDEHTWNDVCEFTLDVMPLIDRELGNWYTSTHPKSNFQNRLIAARATKDGGRISLLNDTLKMRDSQGKAIVHSLKTPDDAREALSTHFGLLVPDEGIFSGWPFA